MSTESYDCSEECFRLRQQFREELPKDLEDVQPCREDVLKGELSPSAIVGDGFRFGKYELVGHGEQTNDRCGLFSHFLACTRLELHDKTVFDAKSGYLVNFKGKADVHPVFWSCNKPSCPQCYERGWAVKQGDKMTFRLFAIRDMLGRDAVGQIQHVIVSIDRKYIYLNERIQRKLALKALERRGVLGGVAVFHGARFNPKTWRWYWSPHLHVVSFVRPSLMRKCRGCVHQNEKGSRVFCEGCSGFYGLSKEMYKKDGCIVEVKDERQSVFGTCWYQLHHATIRRDRKRTNVAVWFGCASYRNAKVSKEAWKEYKEKNKPKCRICGSELVRHEYCGRNSEMLVWYRRKRGSREKIEPFFASAEGLVERRFRWQGG